MPHGIHAQVDAPQPARRGAALDAVHAEADPDELRVRDDSVLTLRKLGHDQVTWDLSIANSAVERSHVWHDDSVAGECARGARGMRRKARAALVVL
jgi:hypothetical protein